MREVMSREGGCDYQGCGRKILARRLCAGHYHQSRRGSLGPLTPRTLDDRSRFWHYVDKGGDNGCWNWVGGIKAGGYGTFTLQGKTVLAHRISMQWTTSEDLSGKFIDHQCRNPRCVNPEHLKIVTHAENMQNKTAYKNSVTGIRGVTPHASGGFVVHVSNGKGKNIYGGRYDSIEEAERAAIKLRNKAYTNNVLDWDE